MPAKKYRSLIAALIVAIACAFDEQGLGLLCMLDDNEYDGLESFEATVIDRLADRRDVVERVPLEVPPRETNIHYLRTKRSKLGHLLSNLEAKPAKR